MLRIGRINTLVFASAVCFAACPSVAEQAPDPDNILKETGVSGGLIVHLNCGEGKLTAAMGSGESFLVHGLDTSAANIARARKHIKDAGLYGKVSVARFAGKHLPYADNLASLILAENLGTVPMTEVMRVLSPGGAAYVKKDRRWNKIVKPWSKDIDEWTHHLHDAGGNAVANDRVAGPPRRLQWTDGPLWARSHGYTPSVSAMVSAAGRLFYICDETLTGAGPDAVSKWRLVARDAFSGVRLWKRPVPVWGSAEFSGTPDIGGGAGSVGRFTMPPNVGKRLVAVGDKVYVTLGPRAPVTVLDAATGKTHRVYKETARADEILCTNGKLIVSINPPVKITPPTRTKITAPEPAPGKHICAIDLKTERILWKKGPFAPVRTTKGQDPFGRLELTADQKRVVLLTRKTIEALDISSGERIWRIDRPKLPASAVTRVGYSAMYEYGLTVMVYRSGVVLLAQPEPDIHHTYHTTPGTLYAFDATTGKQMWKNPYGGWGHHTQHDVFVVGDDVWTHVHTIVTKFGSTGAGGKRAVDQHEINYRIQAIDLKTGKVRKELSTRDLFNVGHHHRCYRNRITERFLTSSRRGVEFVDLDTGEQQQHHWVRSGCLVGNLPCNGLLYTTPHPCGCYRETLLTGFNALAPAATTTARETASGERLRKGPAYQAIGKLESKGDNPADWATYRGNARRSGATDSSVSAKLTVAWKSNIGAAPSGLTIAGGKVHVSAVDAHTIHALNADNGKTAWTFTADGRVDSPPTIHEGLAIFGSSDGRVYCLRAADGAEAWRYEAAGRDRRVVSFGQLESPRPVSGSVLIHEGKCWFSAGRSSYLDGGIIVGALDPKTGKVARRDTIYSPNAKTGKMTPETSQNKIPGLLNDILHTDGSSVFIRQMNVSSPQAKSKTHLYSTGGYLDASWFNRTFWKFGRAQSSGLMVLGEDVVYAMELYSSRSRETVFKPASKAYRLVCYPTKAPARPAKTKVVKSKRPKSKRRAKGTRAIWTQRLDIRVTALIRAGDKLFVAGWPDVIDPKDNSKGVLAVFATDDGRKLAEYKLPAPSVWDGLAASGGKLCAALTNGDIISFKQK
ncbi:MAG: PQQ-binding-like beta-propeller repeat protein [Phycisphaerae bacterium]|nr:PQQ-binding-like beta-propeller repeat protein [Phycisphaerae bacterium]